MPPEANPSSPLTSLKSRPEQVQQPSPVEVSLKPSYLSVFKPLKVAFFESLVDNVATKSPITSLEHCAKFLAKLPPQLGKDIPTEVQFFDEHTFLANGLSIYLLIYL